MDEELGQLDKAHEACAARVSQASEQQLPALVEVPAPAISLEALLAGELDAFTIGLGSAPQPDDDAIRPS